MLGSIGSALTSVLEWFGDVVAAIMPAAEGSGGELNALLPIFSVGIAISICFAVIHLVKRLAWGA